MAIVAALCATPAPLRGDDDAPLGPGEAGRICVRGPTLMDGYLHRAPLGDGFFDTGDLGELDERGVLHVHARRTELIVTGGENVYPAEVEQVLMEVPGIRRALVFGVPDAKWGDAVAAAIVCASPDGEQAVIGQLAAVLDARLASFKRPRLLAVVDAIPELSSGKPDRRRAVETIASRLRSFPR